MNYKKIMLVTFVLLAILTMGAVSASDSADNLTVIDDTDVSQMDVADIIASNDDSKEDVVIGDSPTDERQDSNITIRVDYDAKVNKFIQVYTQLPSDAGGSVTYNFITDVENTSVVYDVGSDFDYDSYYDWEDDIEYESYYKYYTYDVNYFGSLQVNVDYSGDDNYAPASQSFSYFLNNTDYEIYFASYDTIGYGVLDSIEIYAPHNFNSTLTVTVNGKKYNVEYDPNGEETNYYLNASLLDYGENTLSISYGGDDIFGKFDSEVSIIRVSSVFNFKDEISYSEDNVVSLILPDDANGTILVYHYLDFDEELGEYTKFILANETVKGGTVNISLPNLPVSRDYELIAQYSGNYASIYGSEYITVRPIINVPKMVQVGDDVVVTIEGDSNMEGNFNVKITSYDESISEVSNSAYIRNGKGNVTISGLKSGDYSVELEFNDFYTWESLYVINGTKININVDFYFDSLTVGDWEYLYVGYPAYATGNLSLYVDGKLMQTEIIGDNEIEFIVRTDGLDVGNHTLEVKFTSDEFDDVSVSHNFEVEYLRVLIPEEAFLNYDDNPYVNSVLVFFSENMTGTVTIFLDDVEFDRYDIDKSDYRHHFSLRNIPVKDYDVKVVYSGDDKYPEIIKTGKVHLYYDIIVYDDEIGYMNNNSCLYLRVPSDLRGGRLTVTIDGKVYHDEVVDGLAGIRVPDLSYGKHEVIVKYSGDVIYPAIEVNHTIEVKSGIHIPNQWSIGEDIHLILPSDAKGSLCVNISKFEYDDDDNQVLVPYINKEIPLVGGKASLSLDDFERGNYNIQCSYSGNDYNISSEESEFRMGEIVYFDSDETLGALNTISIESPISEGELIVSLKLITGYRDKYEYEPIYSEIFTKTIPVVNNKANCTFKYEFIGKHALFVKYVVGDSVLYEYEEDYLDISPVNFSYPYEIYVNASEEISVEMPKDTSGMLTVSVENVDDERVGVVNASFESGMATVKLPNLPVGEYYLIIDITSNKGSYHRSGWCEVVEQQKVLSNANLKVITSNINAGEVARIVISLNDGITSGLTVDGNPVDIVNGIAVYEISGLNAGNYSVNVKFVGNDEFKADERTVSFKVNGTQDSDNDTNTSEDNSTTEKLDSGLTASVSDIYVGDNAKVLISIDKRVTGTVTVDGKEISIVNGTGSFDISGLKAGNYSVSVKFAGDDLFNASEKTVSFKVFESENTTDKVDPKIVANDLTMQYNTGKYYSVTVYGVDGNVAPDVEVTFTLKGKVIATSKTNENGVAKFKVTQTPVTNAKIVSEALGVNATKKLTVKRVLTLKKVTVKKSAKKLVLTATLKKVNGKYLKGKKITFKFNDKTVKTVKTNKKGVAKVTIKSSVLKKLKVGKKVTYSAKYVKDTVKKTVKVKK